MDADKKPSCERAECNDATGKEDDAPLKCFDGSDAVINCSQQENVELLLLCLVVGCGDAVGESAAKVEWTAQRGVSRIDERDATDKEDDADDDARTNDVLRVAGFVWRLHWLSFTRDAQKRLTTPSSATAEAGALAARWAERRRRKQPA